MQPRTEPKGLERIGIFDPISDNTAASAGLWMVVGCALGWLLFADASLKYVAMVCAAAAVFLAALVFAFVKPIPKAIRHRAFFCLLGLALTALHLGNLKNIQPCEGMFRAQVHSCGISDEESVEVVLKELSFYDETAHEWKPLRGRAWTALGRSFEKLEPGDILTFEGELRAPKTRRNPGGTDQRTVYWAKNISYRAICEEETLQTGKGAVTLRVLLHRARTALETVLEAAGEEGRVLRGILFGDSSVLPEKLLETYRSVGIAHVLAVSGLHVSALASAVLFLFPKRSRIGWALSGLIVCLYGAMAGMTPSVLRAGLMVILRGAGKNQCFQPDSLNLLGAAAVVQLLICPTAVMSLSFQMSYGAVLGILLIGLSWNREIMLRIEKRRKEKDPKNWKQKRRRFYKVLGGLVGALTVSLGAQLGVLPASVQAFGTIPLLSALCNLIVVPLAGVALVGGLVGSVITALFGASPIIGTDALVPAKVAVRAMNAAAAWAKELPLASVTVGAFSALGMAAVLLFLFAVSECVQSGRTRIFLLCAALCIGGAAAGGHYYQKQNLTVTMLDVGQGDAICIRQGDHAVLLDGGDSSRYGDQGASVVLPYLRKMGVDQLDAVIVSHPDRDHSGGLLSVCEALEVKTLYVSTEKGEGAFEELLDCAEEKGAFIRTLRSGQRFGVGEMEFEVLWPRNDRQAEEGNEGSLVLRLEWEDFSACFMGDVGQEVEELLVKQQRIEKTDLLKVAHHGSKTGTGSAFLSDLRPEIALISAGVSNPYGHPAEETLERLERFGTKVYTTKEQGALTVTVAPEGSMRVETVLSK